MTDTVKKRRRWSGVTLTAVLLLAAGSVGWQFRPLNSAERTLLGRWEVLNSHPADTLRFDANRRAFRAGVYVGKWSASEKKILLWTPVAFKDVPGSAWHDRLVRYFKLVLSPLTYEIEWRGPDRFITPGNAIFV